MVVTNKDYSKYDLALRGMKNSKHHVWLAFVNCQHEQKKRIKYLPALRRRNHPFCNCRRQLWRTPAAALCSRHRLGTYRHRTGMACQWQRQHLLPAEHHGMPTPAVSQLRIFYGKSCKTVKWGLLICHPFANYPAFRRMLCDWGESACTWQVGSSPRAVQVKGLGLLAQRQLFTTENTSPQTAL